MVQLLLPVIAIALSPFQDLKQFLMNYCRKMGMFQSLFEIFNYHTSMPCPAPYGFNISFDKIILE
jgi:hypothetical protein